MELSINEINNLTKNNDELVARNERLTKALEEIGELLADESYANTVREIIHKIKEVLQ